MKNNLSLYDRPEITSFLFYPRTDNSKAYGPNMLDLDIPVDEGVVIGARLHIAEKNSPVILFFHGNGEVVSDYDDLGALYTRMNINFLPVDYRGYGRSTGRPSVSAMIKDCHGIYKFIKDWLRDNGYTGKLIIMGRSLGSASALELASQYKNDINGLIIESGFAYALPLLQLLGVNTEALGIKEEDGLNNIGKIMEFTNPTLVIHAERDHIIPFSDGKTLFESSRAQNKQFLKIPGANHNDIFAVGLKEYMNAVRQLVGDASLR